MTSTSVLLTFEDYLAQTDGLEGRYELVNGVLVAMPPESPENLDIAKGLMFALARYVPISLIAYNTEIEAYPRTAEIVQCHYGKSIPQA